MLVPPSGRLDQEYLPICTPIPFESPRHEVGRRLRRGSGRPRPPLASQLIRRRFPVANQWFGPGSPSPSNGRRSVCPRRPGAQSGPGWRHDATTPPAFDELGFRPVTAGQPAERQMDMETVMGQPSSMPVMISPTGLQAIHPDGEVGVASRCQPRASQWACRRSGRCRSRTSSRSTARPSSRSTGPATRTRWSLAMGAAEGRRCRRHDPHARLVVQPWPRLGSPDPAVVHDRGTLPQVPRDPQAEVHVVLDQIREHPETRRARTSSRQPPVFFGLQRLDDDTTADLGGRGLLRSQWDGEFMVKGVVRAKPGGLSTPA